MMSVKTTPKANVGAGIVMAAVLLAALEVSALPANEPAAAQIEAFKTSVANGVEARRKLAQVVNDTVFSFGELAYQEFETSKYLTTLLEANGFMVERGIAGIPTAWVARWGSRGRRATARATIPARPSTSSRRSPSRT
jgi:aminobenzoyl-glutamate utilization protein B